MDLVSSYVKFSATTSGRDKIFRLIQYTSKLTGYVIKSKKNGAELFKRLKQMQGLLSSSRKTFRLGRSIDMLYGAAQALSLEDVQIKTLIITTRLSYAVNFFYDNLDWLIKAGLMTGDSKRYSYLASKYWFYSIVFLILRDFYEIKRLSEGKKLNLQQICRQNPKIMFDFVKNIADLVVCLELLGKIEITDATIGLFGIVSSLGGIVQNLCPQYKISPA